MKSTLLFALCFTSTQLYSTDPSILKAGSTDTHKVPKTEDPVIIDKVSTPLVPSPFMSDETKWL